MSKVDKATVKALELRAPRASTLDAKSLRAQVLGGQVFSAFSDRERASIWDRLRLVEGLIPSLFTFFQDLLYLQPCANCVKRLIRMPPKQKHLKPTVLTTIEQSYKGVNQEASQVTVQVAEASFISKPGGLTERIDLGYRQLYAFAMRHFLEMPKQPIKENVLAKPTAKANKTVLRKFAELARRLGFESPQIDALMLYPNSTTEEEPEPSRPLLVTSGSGEITKQRCGLPLMQTFEEDRKSIFINHLHDEREEQGEGITSFYVIRSRFFAFFGRPTRSGRSLGTGSLNHQPPGSITRDLDSSSPQVLIPSQSTRDLRNMECPSQARQRGQRTDMDLDESNEHEPAITHPGPTRGQEERANPMDDIDMEGISEEQEQEEVVNEQEQQQARQERERQEQLQQADLDISTLQREKLKLEELQALLQNARLKNQLQVEKIRVINLKLEPVKTRLGNAKSQIEGLREMRRLGQEDIQRQKVEIQEQLRRASLANAILQEEKGKFEKLQATLQNVRLQNELQVEKTQVENIRLEQMQSRLQDVGQQISELRGKVRLKQEQEKERQEEERQEEERQEKERQEKEKEIQEVPPKAISLAIGQLGETKTQNIRTGHAHSGPTSQPDSSAGIDLPAVTSLSEQRSDNKVRIKFEIRERFCWREASSIVVDPSNPSEVIRKAKEYMREGLRILDTKLRMLSPDECFRVVTENKTNTILLIPQKELVIDDELIGSAADLHAKRVGTDISRFYPPPKRRGRRRYGRGSQEVKVTPLVLPSLEKGIYGAKVRNLDS